MVRQNLSLKYTCLQLDIRSRPSTVCNATYPHKTSSSHHKEYLCRRRVGEAVDFEITRLRRFSLDASAGIVHVFRAHRAYHPFGAGMLIQAAFVNRNKWLDGTGLICVTSFSIFYGLLNLSLLKTCSATCLCYEKTQNHHKCIIFRNIRRCHFSISALPYHILDFISACGRVD